MERIKFDYSYKKYTASISKKLKTAVYWEDWTGYKKNEVQSAFIK